MMRKCTVLVLAAVFAVVLFSAAVPALSDLMIMPIRTVFTDRDRMKSVSIINTSTKEAVFRLAFYNQKQLESGGYELMKEAPKFDLAKMIVFSPRQVELPPRGKQAVRLSLRRPENLPDGEYRTHLKLERLSSEKPQGKKGAKAVLGINVGFAVPIVLRKGKYDSKIKISDPKFVAGSADGKKPPRVEFILNRSGKHGAMGTGRLFWKPAGGGEERQVGIVNSLNVFSEINKRSAKILLQEKNISGGTLRLTYDGDGPDEGVKYDEVTFPGP